MYISAERKSQIDLLTQRRVEEIRSTPNSEFVCEGNIYFVDTAGDDAYDGMSPLTPWASLERVTEADTAGILKPGDMVCFKRGCRFRGNMTFTCGGMTLTAYGEGRKPEFFSGAYDYAQEKLWRKTDCENVYVCADTFPVHRDIGFITINGGDIYGIKDMIAFDKEKNCTVEVVDNRPFADYRDMNQDCHFFHDWKSGRVYFYSAEGNPGRRFQSMEFSLRQNTITVRCDDMTIDNLCIRHVGSHGVGAMGTTRNLHVQNCEFGWIGGSILHAQYFADGTPGADRYGNAVEIYGGCDNFVVENCLIYQVYDAGITFQYTTEYEGEDASMRNIRFSSNVILNNYYSIEYFLYVHDEEKEKNPSVHENILFDNNICRYSAHGISEQRPDKMGGAHIKAKHVDNCGMNFIIRNNIFDEGRVALIFHATFPLNDRYPFEAPRMEGNTYIQREDGALGFFTDGGKPDADSNISSWSYGERELAYLKRLDPTGEAYLCKKDDYTVLGSGF